MPTIVPPAQPGLGGSSERNDQPTRLPSTSRTRTIRLIGYALIAAGLLFSLIPSEYSDQNLWAYEDWQDGQDVWAPFSGGAIALNTWPFVALVIFGLAGLVCLVWAAQDDRTTL